MIGVVPLPGRAFVLFIAFMLAVDLFAHRRAHVASMRQDPDEGQRAPRLVTI
jgi:hypothetical protein